jgi:DNA-binding response OmpR family regulator
MSQILVVEDEERIARFVSRALVACGWTVDCLSDGALALRRVLAGDYSLVVLDLVIPGMDGHEVLRRITSLRPSQKVLVMSAHSDSATKVRCFEDGAVDYLCKPFSIEELIARVRTRLREVAPIHSDGYLYREGLTVDLTRRKAYLRTGEVGLTEREFLLLVHLMSNADRVFSREELLSEVWGYSFDPGSNVVDVYVRRLRFKVGGDMIETVRNVGYRITAPCLAERADSVLRPALAGDAV